MSYEITKEVPIPTSPKGRLKERFPFSSLQIGESFFVPSSDAPNPTVTSALAYHKKAKEPGKAFISKKWEEVNKETGEIVTGTRVWRTE